MFSTETLGNAADANYGRTLSGKRTVFFWFLFNGHGVVAVNVLHNNKKYLLWSQ